MNGIIIRIYRDTGLELDVHPSETEMEKIKHDFMLFNNNTKEELYKKTNKLIGDIRWKSLFIGS